MKDPGSFSGPSLGVGPVPLGANGASPPKPMELGSFRAEGRKNRRNEERVDIYAWGNINVDIPSYLDRVAK